ncbi:MAG: putative circadian clock protein KaiC [Verrucomicrobiales bacterium]|nr:putative circadian clock protein KaiC [Verrucomicrobiales bacterium]
MANRCDISPGACSTGVPGLDDVLCGGFPRNRLYLIEGDSGVGKTTLALQFLLEGARLNENCLYITLSETKEELVQVAKSHGWSLEKITLLELSSIEQQLKAETDHTFFHPSEVELNKTTKILTDAVDQFKPSRLVFDSLSEMRLMAETPLRYRRQILGLKQFLAGKQCTILLLDDHSGSDTDKQVRSLAHGVIGLQKQSPVYGINRRTLIVEKIRGVKFREGFHDYAIERGGITVYPRLIAAEHRTQFTRETVPSGIKEFDQLLGGGFDRGTSTIIMGPPGTGKSTLTIRQAFVAGQRGEHVNFYLFDETIATFVGRSAALGMDLEPFVAKGLIKIEQIDPAEILPGELMHRIRQAVTEEKTRMVVIDSINGYLNAMPDERYLSMQLHELLAYLNQQGVISMLVLAQQGALGAMQSVVDLTYLADTVVVLRYFEAGGQVKQAISVLKKRSGEHERNIRELKITKEGIMVGEPLNEFHGILTGVPTFVGTSQQMMSSK